VSALLAIDAASARLSVAVRGPAGRVAERELLGARRHAARLGPLVVEALTEVETDLDQLTGIVVSDGPGSFTGLRVAAAFAKGLARTRGLPLWTASTLLVRAAGAPGVHDGRVVAGVGSALRGEVYLGVYRVTTSAIETLLAPTVVRPGTALVDVPRPALVVADLEPAALDPFPWAETALRVGPPAGLPSARVLLELVQVPGGAGIIDVPAGWEPVYGRPAEAQAKWEREHGRPLVVPSRDG